jgi:hypothetical protein
MGIERASVSAQRGFVVTISIQRMSDATNWLLQPLTKCAEVVELSTFVAHNCNIIQRNAC